MGYRDEKEEKAGPIKSVRTQLAVPGFEGRGRKEAMS